MLLRASSEDENGRDCNKRCNNNEKNILDRNGLRCFSGLNGFVSDIVGKAVNVPVVVAHV